MLTKEAYYEAYELGVQQALFEAGLIKEAVGLSQGKQMMNTASRLAAKGTHQVVPDAVALANKPAAGYMMNLGARAKSMAPIMGEGGQAGSSLRELMPQRLKMLERASAAGNRTTRIYPHEMKSLMRFENRLLPTSPEAMPIRPAFGMANRLPPSRLPG